MYFSSFSFSLNNTLQWLLSVAYLKPSQIDTTEHFPKTSKPLLAVYYFRKIAPCQMFDWVEIMHLAYKKLDTEFFEERNTTGRNSFIVHFDPNFGRNFRMKK